MSPIATASLVTALAAGAEPAPEVRYAPVQGHYEPVAGEPGGERPILRLDGPAPGKAIGQVDVAIGTRNLLGIRRLGVDMRTGWLAPSRAFRNEAGDPAGPALRGDDQGFRIVFKYWF